MSLVIDASVLVDIFAPRELGIKDVLGTSSQAPLP